MRVVSSLAVSVLLALAFTAALRATGLPFIACAVIGGVAGGIAGAKLVRKGPSR